MTSNRILVQKLATDVAVADVGSKRVAEKVAARARAIDPEGKYEVVKVFVTIGTLRRIAYQVVNHSPDAAKVEFGQSGAGETGRSGLRPLGRATRSI